MSNIELTYDNLVNVGAEPEPAIETLDPRITFQLMHSLSRIETRLDSIAVRLGDPVRRPEKPTLRSLLISQLLQGWVSETDIIKTTGWQTVGVRSFVTKLNNLGLSVESKEHAGEIYYRLFK